jgi:hypothetical protein
VGSNIVIAGRDGICFIRESEERRENREIDPARPDGARVDKNFFEPIFKFPLDPGNPEGKLDHFVPYRGTRP